MNLRRRNRELQCLVTVLTDTSSTCGADDIASWPLGHDICAGTSELTTSKSSMFDQAFN